MDITDRIIPRFGTSKKEMAFERMFGSGSVLPRERNRKERQETKGNGCLGAREVLAGAGIVGGAVRVNEEAIDRREVAAVQKDAEKKPPELLEPPEAPTKETAEVVAEKPPEPTEKAKPLNEQKNLEFSFGMSDAAKAFVGRRKRRGRRGKNI